ncbi:MAG: hypothetical protein AVDCRST_MAG86-1152 [uncultured Truepera sp.]|uniref:Uncharacterized protein n=1 Tax=uncultured Truepera sp. TaxID=543023 RepID=A0A6J4V2W5_9DEIN|nr:MAG: hypothetical protein AVDCRST_MAG86-1152 [uncultured Truepera sp.]
MGEDCRANATYDRVVDEADVRVGRWTRRPVLVLWGKEGDAEDLYGDPLVIWRNGADEVQGRGLEYGHYPKALLAFFSGGV